MSNWVKIFNSLPAHPKILRAGDRAAWLYVCGLCYANEHLTDGYIAREVLVVAAPGVKAPDRLAQALVASGLWHDVDGGWQIHDYSDVQRTSEQVKESRTWDVGRKALMRNRPLIKAIQERDQNKCRYCGIEVDWTDRRSSSGATYDHVEPRRDHTFENVVVACRGCNQKKGPRNPEQAGMELLPAPNQFADQNRGSEPDQKTVLERREEKREELTPPTPSVEFDEWALHYEQTTGHSLPSRSTKAFKSVVESYGARRSEGYSAGALQVATAGAHADEYRRERGYDVAESILRPTKVAALIAQGKLRSGGGRNGSKSSVELAREFRGGAA